MDARALYQEIIAGLVAAEEKAIFYAAGFVIYLLTGAMEHDDILESGIAQGESQLGEKVQVGANGRAEILKDSHGLAVQAPKSTC